MNAQWQDDERLPQQHQAYNALISFVVMLVFGLIGLVLIAWGVSLLRKPSGKATQGRITEATCDTVKSRPASYRRMSTENVVCNVKVAYKVEGKEYIVGQSTTGVAYKVGDNVNVEYDTANPVAAHIASFSSRTWGMGLVVSGLFLIGIVVYINGTSQ